jgi:hypothetical protein
VKHLTVGSRVDCFGWLLIAGVGVCRDDGPTPAVRALSLRRGEERGASALGERRRVGVAHAGAAPRHHDVLPRLRHHSVRTSVPRLFRQTRLIVS